MTDVFHSLTFNLKVILGLKWVTCKQQIDGSCFLIHSGTLCLLIGAFNPLTFKVLKDINLLPLCCLQSCSVWWCSLVLSSLCCFWSFLLCLFFSPLKESAPKFLAGLVKWSQTSLVFVWETLYLSFYFEWQPCWIKNSWLHVFPVLHGIYPTTPFWTAKFLWISLLRTWSVFLYRLRTFFPLAAFTILILSVCFVNLTLICLVDGQFLLNLVEVLCVSWIVISVSFPRLGNFSAVICT